MYIVKTLSELIKNCKNESQFFALDTLQKRIIAVSISRMTKAEIEIYLKGEHDVLNGFEQDTPFYEKVRELQDDIINFFGDN